MFPMYVTIDSEVASRLGVPVNGEGGFQDLLRTLQRNMNGNVLTISDSTTAERIIRYTEQYGDGGFEGRLKAVADEIKRRANLV